MDGHQQQYRSDAMAAIHETMTALHEIGAVDGQMMRRFDAACLTPIRPSTPEQRQAVRERKRVRRGTEDEK